MPPPPGGRGRRGRRSPTSRQARTSLQGGLAQGGRAGPRRTARAAAPRRARRRHRAGRAGPGGCRPARGAERLRDTAHVGGDDRQPAGERLGDDHAVGLRPAGEHEHVRRRRSAARARRRTSGPVEHEPVVETGLPGARRSLVDEVRRHRSASRRTCTATGGRRRCASAATSTVVALAGRDRADAEQGATVPRCRRPGRRRRPRGGRRGHAPGPGRTSPAARPCDHALGGDDRRGGAHSTRLRVQPRRSASSAERHVHQHDDPQPAARRHHHRPGASRRPGRRPATTDRSGRPGAPAPAASRPPLPPTASTRRPRRGGPTTRRPPAPRTGAGRRCCRRSGRSGSSIPSGTTHVDHPRRVHSVRS